jgi:hypothetical protein
MPFEVVNTSAPKGLIAGQSGYCDVLRTAGVPESICSMLAAMSGYDEALAARGEAVAVRTLRHGGETWGVVTRTVPCGADYTGRANRLAHHLVIAPTELAAFDPAMLLAGFEFRDRYAGEPRVLEEMPRTADHVAIPDAWKMEGLEGWDIKLAQELGRGNGRGLVLLPEGVRLAELVASFIARLRPEERWTFGVCSGCDASSAWKDRVRVRFIVASDGAGEKILATWPGETVHDLRRRPSGSIDRSGPMRSGAGASSRWARIEPEQRIEEPAGSPALTASDAIEIGAIPTLNAEPATLGRSEVGPEERSRAAPVRLGWGIVLVWFLLGAVVGTLLVFVLASMLRQG